MTTVWIALVLASVGAYLLKLAGLSLPGSVINRPRVQLVAGYLPVAVLSGLIITQMFDGGGTWVADWRVLAGFSVAVALLIARRGFLTVFFAAIVVTAALRYFF